MDESIKKDKARTGSTNRCTQKPKMIGLNFLEATPAEKYKKVALILDNPANKTPSGSMLLKSGTITKIKPMNTTTNIMMSLVLMFWLPLIILTSNICIGNVKNIIAARDTEMKFIEPT